LLKYNNDDEYNDDDNSITIITINNNDDDDDDDDNNNNNNNNENGLQRSRLEKIVHSKVENSVSVYNLCSYCKDLKKQQ
jgi:hypothetical protein